ncbi:sugar kinase [Pseudomonadota bacterium]
MKIAIIGECMVELTKQSDNQYTMNFGGDTLNTAIYLSRCGGHADYFTALGDDIYSHQMLSQWQSEGVGTSHVKTHQNKLPGLYIIQNDQHGERFFNYWRDNSAAKTLLADFPEVFAELREYKMIFLSGITLSLYSEDDLTALFSFLKQYRQTGGIVVFDNNYRARNWLSLEQALTVFTSMMQLTDIALLSFDDESSLYGPHTIEQCLARWQGAGVKEIIIKNGAEGCHVFAKQQRHYFELENVVSPIDTTAAGDSFNGAYLASKTQNKPLEVCVANAQACAATVIMYQGAIIDRAIPLLKEEA